MHDLCRGRLITIRLPWTGAPSAKAGCRCRVTEPAGVVGVVTVHIQPAPVACRPPTPHVCFVYLVVRKVFIMSEVDVEILITLVQEHLVLWGKTMEDYKDRIKTRNAWIDVFKQLNEGFEEMGDNKRNEYGEYKYFIYYAKIIRFK